MGPTSPLLLVLLLGTCVGLVAVVIQVNRWIVRAVAGGLIAVLGMVIGLTAVNDHYGYYRSWSSVLADIAGGNSLHLNGDVIRVGNDIVRAGTIKSIALPGKLSHIDRGGLIYLPPQYGDRRYAQVRFPVVELLHGSPGAAADWVSPMNVVKAVAVLIGRHLMGPLVLVMPQTYSGTNYQECVNGKTGADDTYLSTDVPNYVRAHFRVSTDPAQWGLAGYSSGGYCAVNLALRHRGTFGAAASLDGYYRAVDGPAAGALGWDAAAVAANSPLTLAQQLPAGTTPLPSLWISAGTGSAADYVPAEAFVAAMRGLEQVSFVTETGAGHDFYAWTAALPSMLAWMWEQLASPDLRIAFPVVGPPTSVHISPGLSPHRHKPPSIPAAIAAHDKALKQATVTVTVTAPAPPTRSGTTHAPTRTNSTTPGPHPVSSPKPAPTP